MKKLPMLCLVITFLISFAACTVRGPKFTNSSTQDEKIKLFNSWLSDQYKQGEMSNVILYAEKGKIKYYKCLGTADIQETKPLTLDSSFNLASVTKQFTATAIMLLKQDGKLDFDQPVQKYLSKFPYKNITVRHLLNHTSGLVDYMKLARKDHWDDSKIFSTKDMISLFVKYKPDLDFRPGSKFEYSNTGYVFLSAIIERVSGISFESFLSMRIFKPLNMRNSRVFNLLSKDRIFEARVFGKKNKELNDLNYFDGVTGDGGVYSSANDLLKWDQAIYQNRLVKKELQDEAFKPVTLENGEKSYYGFGWSLTKDNDSVCHGGSWVGFRVSIKRNFVNQSLIVILSNYNTYKYNSVLNVIYESLEAIF